MRSADQGSGHVLSKYRKMARIATCTLWVVAVGLVIGFSWEMYWEIYSFNIFRSALADGTATPDDLLDGIRWLYVGQAFLAFGFGFFVWIWRATIRGFVKELEVLEEK